MKSYIISVIVVITVIGCVLSEDILSRTERGARRQSRRAGCKYNKNPKVSPCDPVTNTYNKTFTLKKGRADCNSTMVVSKPCKDSAGGCKYQNNGPWSDCDPVTKMKTKTKVLKDGSGPSCPKTMTKTKPCSNDRRKGRKSKPCKYTKGDWSECDTATNMRKRILTLKKGDRDVCESKKTVLKKCRKECKYEKGNWGACDSSTNMMSRSLKLKKGDPANCDATKTITKPCRRAALRGLSCKYAFGDWGNCNPRTNTMTRTLTLKAGNVNICPKSKILSRKCKSRCKFMKGDWSACDTSTNLMTRVDTLANGNNAFCEKSRTITKKCIKNKKKCKYQLGEWSDCVENFRTRSKILVKGDPKVCTDTTALKRSCIRSNGQERCFFGPWGEFGTCMNGVMTKNRRVLQGGTACERKAVITKGCSS